MVDVYKEANTKLNLGDSHGQIKSKKRRWIVRQFQLGRSPRRIALAQRISRQRVYKLVDEYKQQGETAFEDKPVGRPPLAINERFAERVVALRNKAGYGSVKMHHALSREGFSVSQRQIQRILDVKRLTNPVPNRRGRRNYVRYLWPLPNLLWHTDWSDFGDAHVGAYLDDYTRRVMSAGVFANANSRNSLFLLRQAILENCVSPLVLLSDKGSEFYANTYNKKGKKGVSEFEHEVSRLGIDHWTSRRAHPQTNGKMEKWFDSFKKESPRFDSAQDYVRWYNQERIHSSLGFRAPDEVYFESVK